MNDLVNLIQDFVISALFQPEQGLSQVPLDNPDLRGIGIFHSQPIKDSGEPFPPGQVLVGTAQDPERKASSDHLRRDMTSQKARGPRKEDFTRPVLSFFLQGRR